MAVKLYLTNSTNPYVNLVYENYLFRKHQNEESSDQILILWKSAPSIVMGKFQNPWLECQVKKIRSSGVNLVRRQSGGGCVYHDLGNLNYSFISSKKNYDKSRNANIIVSALRELGISAFENKRHDLRLLHNEVDYKISGCAFKETRSSALHHGTLLIDANLDLLNDLLRSKTQVESALGVKSVSSSVVNLKSIIPLLSEDSIKVAIRKSFATAYDSNVAVEEISEQEICMLPTLMEQIEFQRSWEQIYGVTPKFTFKIEDILVTAKHALVVQTSPDRPELLGLCIDKFFYNDDSVFSSLNEDQQIFINKCYDFLFV